jgi:hypothetical protein
MNGGRGIKKGCLLVFFVKGARTAIVYVLTVLETQNLEPDRTIWSFTSRPLQLLCYRATLHHLLTRRRPSTCRLVVTLDWLSFHHLHANGVVVPHLFLAVDIGVMASSVAVVVFLGAVVP